MKKALKNILLRWDQGIIRSFVLWLWPQYRQTNTDYMAYYEVLFTYFFPQKILRINGSVPWPVDYRSKVIDWPSIEKGTHTEPGDNPGQYINASGGLKMGNNVLIGPNVVIATTNHYKYNYLKTSQKKGITIGNNVWIGGNASILAGSKIGDNVTIGAGCVIADNIPSNCTVTMDYKHLTITPKEDKYEYDCVNDKMF